MRSWLVLLLYLAGSPALMAGEIQHASVQHQDGIYNLELKVALEASFEPVYEIVTDYENLHRISEVLVETSIISAEGTEPPRRRLVTRTCILFFCFTATMVEDVTETEHTITTRIVAEESDYRYGETEWKVSPITAGRSRIDLSCRLEPDFWIPPLIGPYLMKKTMMREARKTILRIEKLAGDDSL